jgi:hypothetical protein
MQWQTSAWTDWEKKTQNPSVRIAGIPDEIWTCNLPNTSQNQYHLSQLVQSNSCWVSM